MSKIYVRAYIRRLVSLGDHDENPSFDELVDPCIFEWVPERKHWKINKEQDVWDNFSSLPFIGTISNHSLRTRRHLKTGEIKITWKPKKSKQFFTFLD